MAASIQKCILQILKKWILQISSFMAQFDTDFSNKVKRNFHLCDIPYFSLIDLSTQVGCFGQVFVLELKNL